MQHGLSRLWTDLIDSDRRLLKKLSMVFIALIVVALGLLFVFVWEGVRTLDRVDAQNDVEIVDSLLADRKKSMINLLRDYAEWTDAYRRLYQKEDLRFATENIAYNLTNNYSIYSAAVVRFDKSVWVRYVNGKKSDHNVLHAQKMRLVDLLLADFKRNNGYPEHRSVVSFAQENGELMMLSASFIARLDEQSGDVLTLPKNPSMLLMSRKLDRATLRDWADLYNIKDVTFSAQPQPANDYFKNTGRFHVSLHDIDGDHLGFISWKPTLSSELVVQELIPNLTCVFLLLAALGAVFFFYVRRAFEHQYKAGRDIDASRQFLQLVFDTDPTHIQVRNKEGQIVFCNAAAASRYGMTADRLTGQSVLSIDADPNRGHMIYEDDLKVIVGGRETAMEESWMDDKGNQRVFYTMRKPIAGFGSESMVLSVSSDITEQKKILEELGKAKSKAEDASRAKTDFLATISHEIRTPMNGILGFSQLLSDTNLTQEQNDHIKIIQNSSRSLLAIINDILDMSKIESGRLQLENIILSPADIVNSVIGVTMPMAKEKNLNIVKEAVGSIPPYLGGDPTRLGQILMNMVSNAVKFTEKGGVTVRMQQIGADKKTTRMKFEIIDTGIGIESGVLKNLFQKFTQADSSTSRKYGGTGLGLAIAKELTELMGGEIGVHSAPGKGAHFWFTVNLSNVT